MHKFEKVQTFIVWHLPKWIIYWAVVRAYANASHVYPTKTPDEITLNEVLKEI